MNQISTVIFDLDGTLLNTLDDIHTSLNYALRLHHMPERSLDEIRSFLGNGMERLLELSVPEGKKNPLFTQILTHYAEYYQIHCNDRTRPYPHIPDLLNALRKLGVRLAIISNKQDKAVQALKELYFTDLIDFAIGPKPGIRKKPAPDATLQVLHMLGSDTTNSLYVGDSEVDIMTAQNAGLPFVCVSWGFRTEEELRQAGAKIVIHDPMELLEYISWLEKQT